MADATALGAVAERHAGSSPALGTIKKLILISFAFLLISFAFLQSIQLFSHG